MTDYTLTTKYVAALIPMSEWSKDHWSTLGYLAIQMIDFRTLVGYDPRMRHNRRNFRLMLEKCPNPPQLNNSRATSPHPGHAPIIEKYSTRLRDKTLAAGHDDWDCVLDMCAEGLFTITPDQFEPGAQLVLSEKGWTVLAALWKHKMAGGFYGNFEPDLIA